VTAIVVTALVIGIPAVAFVLWPLLRGGRSGVLMPLPPDPRERLLEDKARILASLRELTFEHDAGHVSDDDYADLYARYEADAAAVLEELDRVAAATNVPAPYAPEIVSRRSAWTHPIALAASAVGLVVFGILLGSGVARHTAPDPTAGEAPIGSRPLADLSPASPAPTPETPAGGAPRTVTPEILQGMLQAARASLFAGRYSEAIAAYQAVLKRDPSNVDALTHLGLIVALGGHGDTALETFDKALAIDPNYPPALLYRGQVLDEVKHDVPAAIASWEKFVAVAPDGEDKERVTKMIADARSRAAKK
jgi:tetratricopeptide (TPR) repeat protein